MDWSWWRADNDDGPSAADSPILRQKDRREDIGAVSRESRDPFGWWLDGVGTTFKVF
jgi:hypothetical protein